jgi:FAD/FMN-containing dehydrogenase
VMFNLAYALLCARMGQSQESVMDIGKIQNRRSFLSRTLFSATSVGLTSAAAQIRPQLPIDKGVVANLRSKLKGAVVLPGDAGYDEIRHVFFWNPATERKPSVAIRCAHVDDVSRAVEFARTRNLEVAVRGGGHSPMGWGTSNGVVIDMAPLNRFAIDPKARTARIEAGVLSGEVMRQAGRYGLAPVLGQCPGVGAVGVTLGGGLGWLSGLYGASCDNVLAARVVTADSRLVSVDSDSAPDLFWALRGAGANFGITTSFECRLYPIQTVTAGEIHYKLSDARSVTRSFRDFMSEAPDGFQATLNLTPGQRGAFVSLCHAGEAAEAERLLRLLRIVATPTRDTVRRQEFAELAGNVPTGTLNVAYRYVTTVFSNELSDEVIEKALDQLAAAPPAAVIGLTHYMHGEVCRVQPSATAFPHRHSGGVHLRIGIDWNDRLAAQPLMNWANSARSRLRPSSGERIYVGYQSHAGRGSAEAAFGVNFSRLMSLKRKYDPGNVFRRNSNIEPGQA